MAPDSTSSSSSSSYVCVCVCAGVVNHKMIVDFFFLKERKKEEKIRYQEMGRNLHARTVDGARDTMMTVISKKGLGRQRRRRRRRRSTFIDNNDLLLLLPYSLEAFFIIPQSPTSVFQIVFCSFKTERTFNGTVTARSCLNSQVPSLDDKDTKILRISACYNVRRHDV